MAAVPGTALAFPAAALVGATSVAYMTATTAVVQLESARHMVGRVLALQTVLLIGTTPIGGPLMGWLTDTFGGRAPLVVGGAAALGAAAIGWAGARRAHKPGPAGAGDGPTAVAAQGRLAATDRPA
jgi:hypothetical protein